MGDKVLSAKVKEDTELYSRFQEHAEEYQTQSEAVRAAMRAGLEADDDSGDLSPPETADDGGGGGLFKTVASRLTVAMALLLFGVSNVTLAAANSTYNTWGALASMPFFLLTGLALFLSALLMLFYILAVATLRDNSAEDETPGASSQGAESTGAGR